MSNSLNKNDHIDTILNIGVNLPNTNITILKYNYFMAQIGINSEIVKPLVINYPSYIESSDNNYINTCNWNIRSYWDEIRVKHIFCLYKDELCKSIFYIIESFGISSLYSAYLFILYTTSIQISNLINTNYIHEIFRKYQPVVVYGYENIEQKEILLNRILPFYNIPMFELTTTDYYTYNKYLYNFRSNTAAFIEYILPKLIYKGYKKYIYIYNSELFNHTIIHKVLEENNNIYKNMIYSFKEYDIKNRNIPELVKEINVNFNENVKYAIIFNSRYKDIEISQLLEYSQTLTVDYFFCQLPSNYVDGNSLGSYFFSSEYIPVERDYFFINIQKLHYTNPQLSLYTLYFTYLPVYIYIIYRLLSYDVFINTIISTLNSDDIFINKLQDTEIQINKDSIIFYYFSSIKI